MKLCKTLLLPIQCDDLIRLGDEHDGGYVVPQRQVQDAKCLLSLGISSNVSFDIAFQRNNPTVRTIGVDHTVSTPRILRKIVRNGAKCVLYRFLNRRKYSKYRCRILSYIDVLAFFRNPHNQLVHKKVGRSSKDEAVNLTELISMFSDAGTRDVFIKMDIEGSEYEVIDEPAQLQEKLSCVVAEFHDIGQSIKVFNASMEQLSRHFHCVHVHGNNFAPYSKVYDFPDTLEITLLNKSLSGNRIKPAVHSYPIKELDFPCNPNKPDYPLRFNS